MIKKLLIINLFIFLSFILVGCINKGDTDDDTTLKEEIILSTTSKEDATAATEQTTLSQDKDTDYKIDTYIVLNDESTVINGTGATFSDNILTISNAGAYSIKGTLSDGQIFVSTKEKNKKVKLYFDGANITCSNDAPLYIEATPEEAVIILAEGSVNSLKDSADREVPLDGSDYATAVIYSKDDLQLEGTGTLNIEALYNKGIFSKNDIDIKSGNINITSVDDGIRGKDSVDIRSGNITIVCGGDGIRTSEDEDNKGDINISGGSLTVTSDLDAIQATGNLNITSGSFSLVSGGGSTGNVSSDNMGGHPGKVPGRNDFMGAPADSSAYESSQEDEPSTKGIKSDKTIMIKNAVISISSLDDGVHAANVTLGQGAELKLRSDDDGIHGDEEVIINKGSINIEFSYEGIEGKVITVNSGTVIVNSADDGFNASDGSSSSEERNHGPGGMGAMGYSEGCKININDGYILLNSEGDGVDSNGDVDMKGGTVIVFGPSSGANGALDYAGTFNMYSGTLLALGSSGMAQSVTPKNDISVLGFNCTREKNSVTAITDEKDELVIGFVSPKDISNVVYACDNIRKGETYSVYSSGSFSDKGNNGIYTQGTYLKGELLGALEG